MSVGKAGEEAAGGVLGGGEDVAFAGDGFGGHEHAAVADDGVDAGGVGGVDEV